MNKNELADIYENIVNEIDSKSLSLPSLPTELTKINELFNNADDINITDVANIIKTNSALTAKLLQVVNSPALRTRKEITSIVSAVSILGIQTTQNLMMCVLIKDKFKSKNKDLSAILEKAWLDSLNVAIRCFILCEAMEEPMLSPETGLIIGLLHNIGSLVVVSYFEKRGINDISKLLEIINRHGCPLTHKVLKTWYIPEEIIKSIVECESVCQVADISYLKILSAVKRFLNSKDLKFADNIINNHDLSYDALNELFNNHSIEIEDFVNILK